MSFAKAASLFVLLPIATLGLANCNRQDSAAAIAERDAATRPLPVAKTASSPLPESLTLELGKGSKPIVISTEYGQARKDLFRQGLTVGPDKVEYPLAGHPQLNCPPYWKVCEERFLIRQTDGWQHYILLFVDEQTLRVTSIDYPSTADAALSIPPPRAADIPKVSSTYWKARKTLLKLGYKPLKTSNENFKVCVREMEKDHRVDDCERDTLLPEVEACSGTGVGFCAMYWTAPDRRVMKIITTGEPQPHLIYYTEWVKRADLPHD